MKKIEYFCNKCKKQFGEKDLQQGYILDVGYFDLCEKCRKRLKEWFDEPIKK